MAKPITASKLREKTTEELGDFLTEQRRDFFKARFENYTNKLNDTAKLRTVRRTIARTLTLLTERRKVTQASPEQTKE